MDYEIVFKEKLTPDDLAVLDDGINRHTEDRFGKVPRGSLAFFMQDADGRVVAGITGYWNAFGWLYVNSLWVDEEARGSGLGAHLMRLIEDEAVRRGCKHSYLNTMSFQAPAFYEKLGYVEFGRLDDFPRGHSRVFLKKDLPEAIRSTGG